jgi:drug/metabolite transporter (DMT)-like permease
MEERIGELAALGTAFCWTITAIAFETASRKVGSVAVNFIRLVMALALLSIFSWFNRGLFFPLDASVHSWYWLILSGLVGFVIGDLFLFEAFTLIGSRLSMLIMTLVPPITATLGWLIMAEQMSWFNIMGMALTISGIALVIFEKHSAGGKKIRYPVKGLFFAFLGAAGQATGYVLSKYGMGEYDAFAATQIRVIAGIVGFYGCCKFFQKMEGSFWCFASAQAHVAHAAGRNLRTVYRGIIIAAGSPEYHHRYRFNHYGHHSYPYHPAYSYFL